MSAGKMSAGVRRVLGPGNRQANLSGHVGFDSLPDQLVNKAVNKGFDFNILCIGDTGIGKSTLMDCLFRANFEDKPSSHKLPNVSLQANTYTLRESNVNLRLTIIDTLGFGDQIGRADSFRPIIEYIDEQFDAYLQEELKIQRDLTNFHDTRVHACLYFLPPTGHSLKSLDLVCMKELMRKVNIIPIIAKSDTIAKTELARFKGRIMQEVKENAVEIYSFPTDDQTVSELNAKMNDLVPFAVVGSREEVEVNGQKIRARLYPWGTVEVENETHCDFVKLREMLVRTNMEDLREKTHLRHYERYRQKQLAEMGFAQKDETDQPVRLSDLIEQRRAEHLAQMQAREDEMRQMFVNKVKDKEGELKAAEQELHAKFEMLKKTHADEKRKLEERRRLLDEEISSFNKHKAEVQAAQAQAARELAQHSVGSPEGGGKRRK